MPKLRRRFLNEQEMYKGVAQIPEVVGNIDSDSLVEELASRCGVKTVSLESYSMWNGQHTASVADIPSVANTQMHKAGAAVAPLRLPALYPSEQARKQVLRDAGMSVGF